MFRALLFKELRLQRSSLLFALGIVLLWGIMMALTPSTERVLIPHQLTVGQLLQLLQLFMIGPCLLGIVPLFIGATMVAEERRLGVWDWQLSLPAPRATQWAIKLAVGTAIVLTLTFIVQPLLDAGLAHALGAAFNAAISTGAPSHTSYGAPVAGWNSMAAMVGDFLNMSPAYHVLPLLLMAGGAMASSIMGDPYKALFLGPLFAAAALAFAHLVDPAFMLIFPFNAMPDSPPGNYLDLRWQAAMALALCAALAALTYFNFRYEGFRLWRFALQLGALFVIAIFAALGSLHGMLSPRWLITQDRAAIEPLLKRNLQSLGYAPEVNWQGIEPLLVKRPAPIVSSSYGSNDIPPTLRRQSEFLKTEFPIGRIQRLPGTPRVAIELNSLAPNGGEVHAMWQQIVELDVPAGRIHPIDSVPGSLWRVDERDGAYTILNQIGGFRRFAGPIMMSETMMDRWFGGSFEGLPGPREQFYSMPGIVLEGQHNLQRNLIHYLSDLKDGRMAGWTEEFDKDAGQIRYRLVIGKPTDFWRLIDSREGVTAGLSADYHDMVRGYSVSRDGRWYAWLSTPAAPEAQRSFPWNTGEDAFVVATDHSTTLTIHAGEDAILLADFNRHLEAPPEPGQLTSRANGNLHASPSGKYLAFARMKPVLLKVGEQYGVPGNVFDTGYPERLQICLLDLATGRDSVIQDSIQDIEMEKELGRALEHWRYNEWLASDEGKDLLSKRSFIAGPDAALGLQPPRNLLPHLSLEMPIMAWAPGRDVLAVMHGQSIQVFSFDPAWRGVQGVPPSLAIQGFQIEDLDFWDDHTLLMWGKLGLFKIALP